MMGDNRVNPDETLPEILSGTQEPINRRDLHKRLDALLDFADQNGENHDAAAFWVFVGALARGRGISDEIADTAAMHLVEAADPLPNEPADWVLRWQWAMLFALVRRVTLKPREVMPAGFVPSAFLAIASNCVSNPKGGNLPDFLGTQTHKGTGTRVASSVARPLLVEAVYFQAAKLGGSDRAIGKARRDIIGDGIPMDTFAGWVEELVNAKGVTRQQYIEQMKSRVKRENQPFDRLFSPQTIAALIRFAHLPNG